MLAGATQVAILVLRRVGLASLHRGHLTSRLAV